MQLIRLRVCAAWSCILNATQKGQAKHGYLGQNVHLQYPHETAARG